MHDISEIKKSFELLQGRYNAAKEDTIRLETELTAAERELESVKAELLESTGQSTVEEAINYYNTEKQTLDEQLEALSAQMQQILTENTDTTADDDPAARILTGDTEN